MTIPETAINELAARLGRECGEHAITRARLVEATELLRVANEQTATPPTEISGRCDMKRRPNVLVVFAVALIVAAVIVTVRPHSHTPTSRLNGFVAVSECTLYLANPSASPAGNNSNPGTIGAPRLNTVGLSLSNKTICMRGGHWTAGSEWPQLDFSDVSNFTLASYGCEVPIIDGGSDAIVIRSNNTNIKISGITFNGQTNPTFGIGAIDVGATTLQGNNGVIIEDSTFTNQGLTNPNNQDHAIYLANAGTQGSPATGNLNITIRRNRFVNGRGAAVEIGHNNTGNNVLIEDNTVAGFQFGVLISHQSTDGYNIRYNSFYGVTDGSVVLSEYIGNTGETYGPVTNVTIDHNIAMITSSGFGALRVDRVETVGYFGRVNENTNDWVKSAASTPVVWNNTAGALGTYSISLSAYQAASGRGAGDVTVDPVFVNATTNPATANLHLSGSSPGSVLGLGARFASFPSCGTSSTTTTGGPTTTIAPTAVMKWSHTLFDTSGPLLDGATIPFNATPDFYAFLDGTISGTGVDWTFDGAPFHIGDNTAPYSLANELISPSCGPHTAVATEHGGGTAVYSASWTVNGCTPPPTTTTTTIPPPPIPRCVPDVALASTVTASSGSAGVLNDGNETTVWVGGTVPQTITLDLGSPQTIRRVWVRWKNGHAALRWQIETATPAAVFGVRTVLRNFLTNGNDRCVYSPIARRNVRYVRFTLTEMPDGVGDPQIGELGVTGPQ